jgi:hypothetical protein
MDIIRRIERPAGHPPVAPVRRVQRPRRDDERPPDERREDAPARRRDGLPPEEGGGLDVLA